MFGLLFHGLSVPLYPENAPLSFPVTSSKEEIPYLNVKTRFLLISGRKRRNAGGE